MKKSSSGDQINLTVMNILIILGVLAFFAVRLMDSKASFEELNDRDIHNDPLAEVLISDIDLLKRDRLFDNGDGSYSFKGYVDHNYVSYNGIIYRIVEISKDREIVLISNEPITLSPLSQRGEGQRHQSQ